MVATVPEDLQISVGKITATKNLNDTDSFLADLSSGKAIAPTENIMWSNTVNLSQYYEFGRLIPASSSKGTNIFFTPDATEEGKNVARNAKYIQAATGLTPTTSTSSMMATLHARTGAADAWAAPTGTGYTQAVNYMDTQDDGYYVDIPVWIRTSTTENVDLKVEGFVIPKDATNKGLKDATAAELYKATRVAILPAAGDTTNAEKGTKGVIDLKDGAATDTPGWSSVTSIIDYYGTSAMHGIANGAVKAAVDANGTENHVEGGSETNADNWSLIYEAATVYNGTASIATIAGATAGAEYGTATQLWIRVWLEGEDPECWNKNAGQDWNISLKFSKIEPAAPSDP
ncbi:hypothetical protein Rumal_3909 (plasmid) [Ruminococcus albus 7 = DSM 20455]|uniref:Uncharacterized protein n=2 Tax=Ruminococcus albus TaxID=1264 RepID=E6UKY6_RUMA7|nr:hypothetical protein Rumal_3909 [Ruminococcus albus 7 = DSM 20455]